MRPVNEIKASIQQSITYDDRVSPDYANSFQLKRDIDELTDLATRVEELEQKLEFWSGFAPAS